MKNFLRTSLILLFFCVAYASAPQRVFAADISFVPSSRQVEVGQEFYVDIYLDTQGESVNAASLAVIFSEGVSYLYSNDGASVIPLWIENPAENTKGEVSFSGIIPGGFNGYIDPFNVTQRAPGTLLRLFFTAQEAGEITLSGKNIEVYKNDGFGTPVAVEFAPLSLVVVPSTGTVSARISDTEAPLPFTPVIVSEELLFGGEYAVVFTTKDLGSGVAYYEVRENGKQWKRAESPHKLEKQKNLTSVEVAAFDHSGNQQLGNAEIPESLRPRAIPVFTIIGVVALLIVCAILILKWQAIKTYLRKK